MWIIENVFYGCFVKAMATACIILSYLTLHIDYP